MLYRCNEGRFTYHVQGRVFGKAVICNKSKVCLTERNGGGGV